MHRSFHRYVNRKAGQEADPDVRPAIFFSPENSNPTILQFELQPHPRFHLNSSRRSG